MPTAQQRRIARIAAVATLVACPLWAEAWQPLDGPEIARALTGKKLAYENAWQDFRASGRTLYNAGSDSWGTWTTRDDQYCSQWPPDATWACYAVDVNTDETALRFRGQGDDVSVGRFVE
jgi:hypothetical protein